MKKLQKISLALAFCVGLLGSEAMARTEGGYVGIGLSDFSAKHDMQITDGFVQVGTQEKFKKSSTGISLDYRYAYNLGGFFVAPGVFLDLMINQGENVSGDDIDLENRYGVKVDFGFDFGEKFSTYLTVGYGGVSYDVNIRRLVNSSNVSFDSSGREFAPIYGLGFLFDLNERVKFSLEANHQSLEIPLSNSVGYDYSETDLTSVKFGVLFGF